MTIWGIGVDDSHHLKRPWDTDIAPPGKAWIVVRSESRERAAILDAIRRGDFYASTGVELVDYFAGEKSIEVKVKEKNGAHYRVQFIGLGGRVRIASRWRLYGSWMDYDYPSSVGLIPRADSLGLLSESAATLAYSLVDRFARIGVERTVGAKLVNFDLGSDRSAVDGSVQDSISASVLWPVGRRLDLEVHLGTSRIEGDQSSLYGGLSIIIYGGG